MAHAGGPPGRALGENPVSTFFRSTNLTFALYDTRRGQCEGEEHEKLLSFFPTIAPVHVRTSIVGLAQAVASFADTLTQEGCRFKTLVAEQNKWVMCEVEPCIWLLAVVRKTWASGACTDAAYKALLTSTYDMFVLLHGRVNTLLEQDPSGFAVRRVFQPLLDEVGSRLLRPDAASAREPGGHAALLANPLAPHAPTALPLLAPSHAAFLAVQCLVNQLLIASFYGARLVSGCVVMWNGLPVWSSLGPEDTGALLGLAARALVPAARAAQRQGRLPGAGALMMAATGAVAATETAYETLVSPLQWRPGGGIQAGGGGAAAAAATSSSAAAGGPTLPTSVGSSGLLAFGAGGLAAADNPGGASPRLPVSSSAAAGPSVTAASAAAAAAPGGAAGVGSVLPPFLASFLRPRLRPSMYTGPGGAALALPIESVLPMAHVWLRGSHEWAQLLPYHRGPLLVLALLHDGPPPGAEVLAALAAVLQRGAAPAAAALAAEVPARSVWHEKGHRYCFTDALHHASRYSPLKKVQTLSSSALRHAAHLRSKLDDWEHHARQQAAGAAAAVGLGPQASGALEGQTAAAPGQPGEQAEAGGAAGDAAAGSSSAAPAPAAPSQASGAAATPAAAPSPVPILSPADCDCEMVVRTGHDAWLVLRSAPGGRRLYAASEWGQDLTLASAVAPTDVLSDRLFPGVFLPS
ncbi:hypothetical protein HYH03_004103 [Edaphochlamys debaryana]|uniref:CCZ1/INTU/HSP4 first Longin domain-containing protein n=1 Tax=Edaphochlamys debaryana TaxID=47281 RepID=A0A836C3H8_9CHLO|nr:hypothetical protein HYH03_004103 [Edaphochlamys debaryana]|eukprot:KAG2497833.1 hypothetical protein HYH03_004103 [Edaphochlamys debaryana]